MQKGEGLIINSNSKRSEPLINVDKSYVLVSDM